jgi:hypothetical protein
VKPCMGRGTILRATPGMLRIVLLSTDLRKRWLGSLTDTITALRGRESDTEYRSPWTSPPEHRTYTAVYCVNRSLLRSNPDVHIRRPLFVCRHVRRHSVRSLVLH